MIQLPLTLKWPDEATFEHFYAVKDPNWLSYLQDTLQNGEALTYIYPFDVGEQTIGIQGKQGVGLTHLLYAACHQAQQKGKTAVYLPLKHVTLCDALLEGMENLDLICLDDIETIVGDLEKETSLFHFYNRAQASGAHLLIASHTSPNQKWALRDLASRLAAGIIITIPALSDSEKIAALQQRAKRRGLEMSDKVGQYLLQHYSRDMEQLLKAFETLDHFSLSAQRHLTIPLIKAALLKN